MKEIVDTVDGQLVFSLIKLVECFFTPFSPKEVRLCVIMAFNRIFQRLSVAITNVFCC